MHAVPVEAWDPLYLDLPTYRGVALKLELLANIQVLP